MFWRLLLILPLMCLPAQARDMLDYPSLGISVSVPDGWEAEQDGDYLVMVSRDQPGLIALTLNDATDVTDLKDAAGGGIVEEGIFLRRGGDFERVGTEGLGAEFYGMFQGAQAKAFVAGVINPFGKGVTIIALTSSDAYGPKQVALVKDIADGLSFAEPQEPEEVANWRRQLGGMKLTYLKSGGGSGNSYMDSSGMTYSSYSSYSSRHTILFCSDNSFHDSSANSASFDAEGGFGGGLSQDAGIGTWDVSAGSDGGTLLVLTFASGETARYEITRKKGKTFLNGTRYFLTNSDHCR